MKVGWKDESDRLPAFSEALGRLYKDTGDHRTGQSELVQGEFSFLLFLQIALEPCAYYMPVIGKTEIVPALVTSQQGGELSNTYK